MTLAGLLAYVVALAIAVAVPGPGVVAVTGRALAGGTARAMPFVVGLALGDIVYLTAACYGLALVAQSLGTLFVVIRYAAALYLAFLAYRLWRSAGRPVASGEPGNGLPVASLLAGLGVSLGNPKVIFFYLALLPTLIDLRAVTAADFAGLSAATFIVLMAVMTPYVVLASRARRFLSTERALRRLNRVAASVVAGAAAWIVLRSA